MKRKTISKKTRFEVFKRDGFVCMYCGAHPPGVVLHVDHIVAVAAGGDNAIDNLVTACEPCNAGKGARDLKVSPQSLSDKAKDIAEREAQLAGYQSVMADKRDRLEDEAWRVMDVLYDNPETARRLDLLSIKRFLEHEGLDMVLECAEVARAKGPYDEKRKFKYFCGVYWRMVKEGQSA